MTIYNVYIKPDDSKLIYDKRFEANNLDELANKVKNYFRFKFQLARVEVVTVVEDYIKIRFGNNFNVEA